MSLSTATRISANSPSSSANSSSANSSSAGPVLPSFAQTFSDLAGSTHTRSPPEMQNTHSFHSDIDYAAERRDQDRDRERDRERDRDRDRDRTGREQDHSHSHTEHRSRLSSHNQDTVLPPILSHQDNTHASNSKKRSLDDTRRDDNREPERRQDPARDDRTKEGERRSPSQIKREPSLSPSPDQQQHPSHHSRYLQQSHSYSSYPHHSPNLSNKRRKNNHELPPSPPDPHNERDAEHSSYSDSYSHAHNQTQRVTAPSALAQSNPSSASSSSSSTTRTSPPMKRLSAIGSRANSLSPHQSANIIHPQTSSHNSSRSPNHAPLQPPPISKSPSQSHLRPPSQQPYQSSLLSSHFSMALPAPSDSFSTNRKKKLSAQYQGDISVPVPRPINTGSRSATPTMATAGSGPGSAPTPGSASGPGLISAPGVNPSGSNTNHHHNNNSNSNSNNNNNNNIANNLVAPSTTPSSLQPRGPPRHLTIAPHPRTRRLEPVIHSAPVNGGFFHGTGDSNHSNRENNMNAGGGSAGGVTIRSVGISSVRLHATHASNNVEYNSTASSSSSLMASAPGTTAAAAATTTTTASASTNSSLHPPVTPMRIPELPPIPITPNGRKNINTSSGTTFFSSQMTGDNHLPHPYSRLPPPYSAGLLGRFDKETAERPSMSMSILGSSRFVLDRERLEKDRERLILERDRSERDRGADVPIAKNGGMRSGMVLGSINVPRTPLFSSFGQGQQQPPASASAIANGGVRSQQGRPVSSTSSTKFLQVPHTAGLNQSSSNGTDAASSSSSSLHTAKQATTSNTTAGSSNSSGAAIAAAINGSLSSTDPKSSFLTLFSDFYDSLADSKLLKSWLHEQLVKSNTLIEHLEKAATANGRVSGNGGSTSVGTLDSLGSSSAGTTTTITMTVSQLEDLIERRLGPVKNETEGLKRRVGELEEMVYEARKSGWGKRDNNAMEEVSSSGKKRRRHEENSSASSTVVAVPPLPVVSIRTSPPPPLVLTPSSVAVVASAVIPRAPASAPLLLEDQNRHLGVPLSRVRDMEGVAKSDKKRTRVVSENGSPPRSHSRTGTRASTNGQDSTSISISISKSLKSSDRDREREDDVDVDMDGRVNRSNDEDEGDTHDRESVVTVSVPEHRTSAVRLES